MDLTRYWESIDQQLTECRKATTVDQVMAACPAEPGTSVGEGWFGGSGGDEQLSDALMHHAGAWKFVRYEADYYWVARDCNGDLLSYTEGDLSRGDNPRCGA